MTSNTAKKLIVGTGLVLVVYLLLSALGVGTPSEDDFSDAPLTFTLDRIAEPSVDAIELPWVDPPVRLEKRLGQWYANGFLADSLVMSEFWRVMGEAEIRDLAGSNPENYGRLGVDESTAPRVVFEFTDGGSDTLFVGEFNARLESSYVRRQADQEAYLIDGELRLYGVRTLAGWRNHVITDLDRERFQELRITREEGSYTLSRESGLWTLAEGDSARSATVDAILEELSHLRAERVLPRDSIGFNNPPLRSIEAVGPDGERLTRLNLYLSENRKYFVVPEADSTMYMITGPQGDRLTPRVEAVSGGG